jgi:peptidoglycan DL-endopeptidase LytE
MKQSILFLLYLNFFSACSTKTVIITKVSDSKKQPKEIILKNTVEKTNLNKILATEENIPLEKVEKEKWTKSSDNEVEFPNNIDDTFILNDVSSEKDTLSIPENTEPISYNAILADKIVAAALENIGVHYHTGGTTPAGFDCSGLIVASFSKCDVKLPRTSNDMSRFGKRINPALAQKGDLIFFKTLGSRKINHVGMVIEVNENEIKFVHASIKKGVMVSTTKEGYYKNAFAQVNRVLE